jgi:hypothetical protein
MGGGTHRCFARARGRTSPARCASSQTRRPSPVPREGGHKNEGRKGKGGAVGQPGNPRPTTVSSFPAALRKALVHRTLRGLRFFLKFLWHLERQKRKILLSLRTN